MPSPTRPPFESEFPVQTLKWLAGASALIGALALLAVVSGGAWAADNETPGFNGGGKTFNNPFAPAPGGPGAPPPPFFEDDDFADDDATAEDFSNFKRPGSPGAGAGLGNVQPAPKAARGSAPSSAPISMGGSSSGSGVIERAAPAPIKIEDETGLGPGAKEMVTDFNFPDADILDIAKSLGKLTGKNFILDKDVKGRVTIISNSPITVSDAWKAFLTALDMTGFALIPSGNYIRIARQRDARDKQLKTYTGDYAPSSDALITRVFPLKYIDAENITRVLRSFMPTSSRIIPHEQTNTVIVTDTGANISKINRMLEILDIEGYDAGIEVIPVKFASAGELSKLIDTLIPGTSAGGVSGAARPAGGFGGGSRFAARRTKEGGIINTIIADERTNTLIVHANTKGADQVRELVAKLDQKIPAQTGGGRVHVVYLQFAESESIANTLNNLSQGAGRATAPQAAGGTGVNPMATNLFEGNIKVSPDKATNSLVITASPGDFVTIQRVINKLDIPRDEVYVEIVIMEMLISRLFEISTNIVNPTSAGTLSGSIPSGDLFNFLQNPISQKGLVLGFQAGQKKSFTIAGQTFSVSSIQGLIKAIQTNDYGNVLATPQILTLDNTEATFESAEKIPVPTVTAIQGSTATGYNKESVSLSIKIKPQINKMSNFVKLDVTTKLADINNRAVPDQVRGFAFGTTERNAQTSVVVADSDTVVLGGLIRDKQNESVSKVPLLGDIPLLGWLFRSKNTTSEKTNLMIFMTPHIVRQYEKVRALLDRKLKEREDFIERQAGGRDLMREYRDDLIRRLPNMSDITSYRPKTAETLDSDSGLPAKEVSPENPFTGGTPPPGETQTAPTAPVNEGANPGTPQ
ncbi:MAG: type II secretion system secretin GspD [Oligoflexia bacterium]